MAKTGKTVVFAKRPKEFEQKKKTTKIRPEKKKKNLGVETTYDGFLIELEPRRRWRDTSGRGIRKRRGYYYFFVFFFNTIYLFGVFIIFFVFYAFFYGADVYYFIPTYYIV